MSTIAARLGAGAAIRDPRSARMASSPRPLPIKPLILRVFYCFVFSIPFESVQTFFTSGSLSLSKLVGYVFILCSVLQPQLLFRRPPRPFYYFVGYLCFLVVYASQLPQTYFRGIVAALVMLVQMIVLFWMSYNLLRFRPVRLNFLKTLVASCLLLGVLQLTGVTAVASHASTAGMRVTSLGENLNTTGAVFAIGLISLIGLALRREAGWARKFAWPLCLIMAVPLIQTGSRGALVAFAFGTITILLQHGGLATKVKGVLVAGVILGLMVVLTLQSGLARARWEQTLFSKNKVAGRDYIFSAAMDMIVAKPMLGWGPVRNVYELGRRTGDPTKDTHNTYLCFLTEVGIAGSVPMFLAFALCVRRAWRARKSIDGVLPLALLVTVLAVSLSGTNHNRKWFWLVLALSLASGTEAATSRPRSDRTLTTGLPRLRASPRQVGVGRMG